MDLEQFYETPKYLAIRMAMKFKNSPKKILEPGAGSGALMSAVEKIFGRDTRVNWFEINNERREVLKRRNRFSLLGEDFLSDWSVDGKFDGVIMNPPFRNAEDHFFKAYNTLEDGGEMVCLLSSATLEGKSTKERLLLDIIKQHKGDIEAVGDAFNKKDALRKTSVDCSLVYFQKGIKKETNDFTEGMGDTVKHELALLAPETSELEVYNYIKTMIKSYNETQDAHIRYLEGYYQLKESMPEGVSGDFLPILGKGDFASELRSKCWDQIFKKTKIANYMNEGMKDDFSKLQDGQNAKEFTLENIESLLYNLRMSISGIANKALEDVFIRFTKFHKKNRLHTEGWKTNSAWKVNRKVILPDVLEWPSSGEPPRYIGYRERERLSDIEKALCLMVGKKFEDISTGGYTSTIELALGGHFNEESFGTWHDSYFFKVKIFKKRTMHLVFKDEKIWEGFNKSVCDGKMWIGMD